MKTQHTSRHSFRVTLSALPRQTLYCHDNKSPTCTHPLTNAIKEHHSTHKQQVREIKEKQRTLTTENVTAQEQEHDQLYSRIDNYYHTPTSYYSIWTCEYNTPTTYTAIPNEQSHNT